MRQSLLVLMGCLGLNGCSTEEDGGGVKAVGSPSSPTNAGPCTYMVSPGGSGSDLTLSEANAALRPGQTACLKSGVYAQVIAPAQSGRQGQLIIYTSAPGLDVQDVQIIGTARTSLANLGARSYIKVEKLTFKHSYADERPGDQVRINWISVGGSHNVVSGNRLVRSEPSYGKADPREAHLRRYAARYKEVGIDITGAGASDNLIEGNHVYGVNMGVRIGEEGVKNVIRGNRIENSGQSSVVINTSKSRIRGLLIEGNTLSGSWVEDGIQFTQDFKAENGKTDVSNRGTVVRGNLISWAGENGIDVKGTSDVVIEGNVIRKVFGSNNGAVQGLIKASDARTCASAMAHGQVNAALPVFGTRDNTGSTPCWNRVSSAVFGKGANTNSVNIIYRRNIVYDGSSGINMEGMNWKFYNNTLLGNNTDFTGSNSAFNRKMQFSAGRFVTGLAGMSFLNNIIGGHKHGELIGNAAGLSKVAIDHNLYWQSGQEPIKFHDTARFVTFQVWKGLAGKSRDLHSLVVSNPQFSGVTSPHLTADMPRASFALRASSPAVDKGGFLTRTVVGGSGTAVKVADSRFFFDGYGIVSGDRVRIGNDRAVIVRIDYARHELILAAAISFAANEPVSLDYAGAGPDIGAIEHAP